MPAIREAGGPPACRADCNSAPCGCEQGAKRSDFFARRPEAPVVCCVPFTIIIDVVGGHSSLLLVVAVASSSSSSVYAFEIRSVVHF